MAHSAFGRNAGLTQEQVRNLRRLDLEKFEHREYIALNWVRHFLTCPDGVPVDVEEEFITTFTPGEQLYIKTSMKGMFFFNLLFSTMAQGKTGSRVASWIVEPMLYIGDQRQRVSREKASPAQVSSDGQLP